MMTIKHVDLHGEEFVYPTTHINFVPASAKNCAPASDSLWRYDEEGRASEITDGRAYVMNEHGKTVARYDLSDISLAKLAQPTGRPIGSGGIGG
jgi:hypothetical protein